MKFLRFQDLKPQKGIPFSRVHIDRLQKAGKFPRKVKIGANTAVYPEEEIDGWLKERCAERDCLGT